VRPLLEDEPLEPEEEDEPLELDEPEEPALRVLPVPSPDDVEPEPRVYPRPFTT